MSIINLEFCKKKPHGYWILEHNTAMDAAKDTSVKKHQKISGIFVVFLQSVCVAFNGGICYYIR
jgi:hypothetical protein